MSDCLTSRDRLALVALWQRYDAAGEHDKEELRTIIELHISAGTIRTMTVDLQRFHDERMK